MLVSVFVPVTRRRAVVPAALRNSASASICGAPLGLRGAVSLIAHPSLFATYGFSHACTVSSISELEKYFICIVSILAHARVQRRRRLRVAHNLRARRLHVVADSGKTCRIRRLHLVVRQPQHIPGQRQLAGVWVEVHKRGIDRRPLPRQRERPRDLRQRLVRNLSPPAALRSGPRCSPAAWSQIPAAPGADSSAAPSALRQ